LTGQPPSGDDAQAAVGGEKPSPEQAPQPAPETPAPAPETPPAPQAQAEPQPPEPQAQQPAQVTAPQIPPKKKKKRAPVPVAEWLQKDLNNFLTEFMSEDVKDENGRVNYLPYVKKAVEVITENVDTTMVKCHLDIPESHMKGHVQNRDIKLAAVDSMRKQTYYGQYSKGSVDITKNGRYYLLEYVKEIGWVV
jgi:pyruvate/2-oxoglutarate dehydrogenase complex dihydrolipoamide acyltransferase (E2) component